jgi:hypothetical protein
MVRLALRTMWIVRARVAYDHKGATFSNETLQNVIVLSASTSPVRMNAV